MAYLQRSVVWAPNAYWMFDEALAFIASGSKIACENFLDDVFHATDQLGKFADDGRVVPELRRRDIREVFVGRYRLQYRVGRERVEIVALSRSR